MLRWMIGLVGSLGLLLSAGLAAARHQDPALMMLVRMRGD